VLRELHATSMSCSTTSIASLTSSFSLPLVPTAAQASAGGTGGRTVPGVDRGHVRAEGVARGGTWWHVVVLAVQPDPLHLVVRVWPSDSAAQVVAVPPAYTSQDCSGCGRRIPKSHSVPPHSLQRAECQRVTILAAGGMSAASRAGCPTARGTWQQSDGPPRYTACRGCRRSPGR